MEKSDFSEIKYFIVSILKLLDETLDRETINAVEHYLYHGEYEMAFEGLFIEIMKLPDIPKINFLETVKIGKLLNLDKESIFDYNFWENLNKYILNR